MSPVGGDERGGSRGRSRDAGEPGAAWDFAEEDRGGPSGGARRRPWWASGNGGAGTGPGAADERSRSVPPGGHAHTHEGPGGTPPHDTCQICPVCSLLRTLDEVRPEVVEHLSEAARHVTLAAKAFIDAQAAGYARPGARRGFEHIDLDD